LVDGARTLGVALDEPQVDKLDRYLELLRAWNQKINLTAITEERAVVDLHFLDSLALVPLVRACATLIDVGAGAGFPGAVLAIALPHLRVTAIDGVAKKVAFLQTLKRSVAPNLDPRHVREDQIEEQFEAAVSRATWDPAVWIERGARLALPGGLLVAMQTGDAPLLAAPAGFVALPPLRYEAGEATRRLQPFRRRQD
jgi:16S rRNA (guanine527-N7)-methyltransferase